MNATAPDILGNVKVTQLCPCLTLYDSMDCPWDSPGQNTGVGSLSLLQRIFPTQGLNPGLLHWRQILYQLSHKGNLVGSVSLLQGIFLTQVSNKGLPHCRQILYQLSYHRTSLGDVHKWHTFSFPGPVPPADIRPYSFQRCFRSNWSLSLDQ